MNLTPAQRTTLRTYIIAECGQKLVEYFVEVVSPEFDKKMPGPHFYPVAWLRRFDPTLNRQH